MLEQLGLRHVVQPDVHVLEVLWEEVVDLSRHVQDVANPADTKSTTRLRTCCFWEGYNAKYLGCASHQVKSLTDAGF